MIFSNKILKVNDGINSTLFIKNNNSLNLFLFDKTLKKYEIQTVNNRKCVFIKEYEYEKIIQLNNNSICPCSNGFITIINETE